MSGTLSVQYHLCTVLNWVFCGQLLTYLNLNAVFQNVTYPSTSFTDLAEIVSRIEPVKAAVADGESRDVWVPGGCVPYSSYPHLTERKHVSTCAKTDFSSSLCCLCALLASLFGLCPLEKGGGRLKARLLRAALNQTQSDSWAQLPYARPY